MFVKEAQHEKRVMRNKLFYCDMLTHAFGFIAAQGPLLLAWINFNSHRNK